MNDYNKTILTGRLTRDLELRYTPSGQAVTDGSLANNRKNKDKEKTVFVNFTAWGKSAELMCEYLKKGSKVLLSGRLDQDSWEKDGQKFTKHFMVVEDFVMLDNKKEELN